MKKIAIIFLSVAVLLGVFILEGGMLQALFIVSAFVPMLLGPYLSSLFTFSNAEITVAFRDAFANRSDLNQVEAYSTSLQVVRHLQTSVMHWAATIVVLALIGILSSLTDVSRLGPSVAAGLVALLLGFGFRAVLLGPMESSICKKLALAGILYTSTCAPGCVKF